MEGFSKIGKKSLKEVSGKVCSICSPWAQMRPILKKVVEIINSYPAVYGAIGIHPHNSKDYNPQLGKIIAAFLKDKRIVAYGGR